MKKFFLFFILICLIFVSCKATNNELNTVATNTATKDTIAYIAGDVVKDFFYSMGNYYANNFSEAYPDMDLDSFVLGVIDYQNGIELTIDEITEIISRYNDVKMKEMGDKNIKEAEEFLAENKNNEGVITTESGLQYKVLEEGTGPKPTDNAVVSVIYELTLLDGTMIDSSWGSEASLDLSNVIPGFAEAVKLMNTGSHITTWIHPSLGYGEQGNQSIEPQSLLVFDIQLVSFEERADENE